DVAADDGVVGGVGDIDAVLALAVGAGVVLDGDVLGEAGEDAPRAVVVGVVVLDGDVGVGDGADAGARDGAVGVVDGEAVDDDVPGVFDVDAIGGFGVARGDDDRACGRARIGLDSDGRGSGAVDGAVGKLARVVPANDEAGVGAGENVHD